MGFDNDFNNDKNRRIERIEMVNLIIEAVRLISMDDPRCWKILLSIMENMCRYFVIVYSLVSLSWYIYPYISLIYPMSKLCLYIKWDKLRSRNNLFISLRYGIWMWSCPLILCEDITLCHSYTFLRQLSRHNFHTYCDKGTQLMMIVSAKNVNKLNVYLLQADNQGLREC